MKKLLVLLMVLGLVIVSSGMALASTVTFTASDVKAVMSSNGAPLHDASNQWGLWAVRAMPIVGGSGSYTITGGLTSQVGWGVDAPNGLFGNSPYTALNSAWFWDASGAEVAGDPPNPLYMIMDQPADTFTSYFGNIVTAVNGSSTFAFDFTLGAGATWDGRWQFVVDGSKYALGSTGAPGDWVEDFFGGYGTGGSLSLNTESGYPSSVPEPVSMLLLGLGLMGIAGIRRKFKN